MRWSLADVAADSAYHGVRRRAALALSTGLAAVRCLDRPCLKQISVQTLQASGFFVPAGVQREIRLHRRYPNLCAMAAHVCDLSL